MSKKIFLIAGEPSGDTLGAGLIRALKETDGTIELTGIGGPAMQAEGLKSLLPMEELSVMGIWEVIWQLPRLLSLINGVVDEIEKYNPDAVITVDLPDFNFQVASRLKKRGTSQAKVIHYVAPTVWAWRPGRAKKIAGFLDGLICLFPFEPDHFKPHNLSAEFVGHPLIENGLEDIDGQIYRDGYEDKKILGLFLGSREAEIKSLANVFKETVAILKEQNPDLEILIPTLPNLEYNVMQMTQDWEWPVRVASDLEQKWQAFRACDVALAASGTVGLELSYIGVPHVIVYKMHPITWLTVKQLVKVKYAHLANILLDRPIVPEFLQSKCDSLSISEAILGLLKNAEEQEKQKQEFQQIPALLGAGKDRSPSQKAADYILKMISN